MHLSCKVIAINRRLLLLIIIGKERKIIGKLSQEYSFSYNTKKIDSQRVPPNYRLNTKSLIMQIVNDNNL